MSAGTLVAAIAVPGGAALAGALFYLAHSAVIGAASFLIADSIAERRGAMRDRLFVGPPPAQFALWSLLFLASAMAVVGFPPLSGFVGKLGMLAGSLGAPGDAWFWSVLLVASLIGTVALARAGSRVFWEAEGDPPAAAPRVAPVELAAILVLMGYGAALVVLAGPVQRYASAAAQQLGTPSVSVDAVLGATPVPRLPGFGHH